MFGVVFEWIKKHPELKYYVAAHRDGNENSKMTMRKLGFKPDYVEKDVVWLDGQVADKFFYRAPILANVTKAQHDVKLASGIKSDLSRRKIQ